MRVVAADPLGEPGLAHLSLTLMRRSSLYFAIGLRLFFAFGPFVLWVLGPTTLLVASIADVAAQLLFDVVPAADVEGGGEHAAGDEGAEEEGGAGGKARVEAAPLVESQR
jgi:hypothetical protein